MAKKKYGFTGKVTQHNPGMYLRIPDLVVESADIEDKEKIQLNLRNMQDKTVKKTVTAQGSSGQVKVYLPKNIKTELGLHHQDLVDVYFYKE